MLAKRERFLLAVLGGIVALCALVIAFMLGLERLNEPRRKAAQYESQIAKLSGSLPSEEEIALQRDALKAELADRTARFYKPDELNPYSFGTLITKKLSSHGITVVRYQVVEVSRRSFLEFTVSGAVRSLILFLKEVSESEKYWTIPSLTLTIREGTLTADAVFRIGYEVLDAKSN
jgi:hypothetical protein